MPKVIKTKPATQIRLSRSKGPREHAGRDEGRGRVSRRPLGSQLSEVQRVRVLSAAAVVVSEGGYGAMSVARVTTRAGVSRRTFYDLFEDRQDCFLAVFDSAVARAGDVAGVAYERAGGGWRERVRAGLGALLEFFDDEPRLGSLLVVDALGAGPRVLERRAQVLETLAWIVEEGRTSPGPASARKRSHTPPLAAEGAVGAVLSVIHARMLPAGHGARPSPPLRLAGLLNELMGMIVLPYLGPTAAEEELARGAPKPQSRPPRPVEDPLDALPMRLTYRTLRVLAAIAELGERGPAPSNRHVGELAGVSDQGQISKLLARLERLDLIHNSGHGQPRGEPNAWTLTTKGKEIQHTIQNHTGN
jgi:AcrR family transcriptional regulator